MDDVLLDKIKSGDNDAWETLYKKYEKLIHKLAWNELREVDMPVDRKKAMEEDLFQAGWIGFISSLKNYDKSKGAFSTLAGNYATWEIKREKSFLFQNINKELAIEIAKSMEPDKSVSLEPATVGDRFNGRQLVLQLLTILRFFTDEEHPITKEELAEKLKLYRNAKYHNSFMESPNTFSDAVKDLLSDISEVSYYEKKPGEISNLYYSHPFKNEELDEIVQLIAFTDMLSKEEKERLIEKLVGITSLHYRNPFWDGKKLRFNPKAVYGRSSLETVKDRNLLAENIKVLQNAINNLAQVKFAFNKYQSDGLLRPSSKHSHSLSPYHLVVYHDKFYCIGLKNDDNRIWHYRVDLMTDIKIVKDDTGVPIPAKVCDFPGLPIGNFTWNPEKYMAEHLYMAYDEPRDILVKIKKNDHTILHDWFGNHYELLRGSCGEEYDLVKIKTSPIMMVHWALQYGNAVEVMDEEIRLKIMEELKSLEQRYSSGLR